MQRRGVISARPGVDDGLAGRALVGRADELPGPGSTELGDEASACMSREGAHVRGSLATTLTALDRAGGPMPDDLTRTIDLVRLAQAGERGALDALCARYYERVRVLVRARLGPPLRRVVDSGDVLQETFLQAVRNFDRFEMREDAALIHWLAKISERQVIAIVDRARAQKRDRAREVDLASATAEFDASCDRVPAPAEASARSEEDEAVVACLDELEPGQREVILLRDYAGASWPMIVEETGLANESAARREHARALVELGRRLRAKGIR